jgi:hypothetical protein
MAFLLREDLLKQVEKIAEPLWGFGVGQTKGIFFNPGLKNAPTNLGPDECYIRWNAYTKRTHTRL